ncbi:MAG: response regulator [Pseudomonadota bacterium]
MNNNSRLLIIDDEKHVRDTLEMLFTSEGYQLTFATNGQEALEKVEELMPDIILLDVMMPEIDGFEVCKRLRATPKVAQVPIIMLTTLDDRESRLRGLEAGADEFLRKPIDWAELQARIRTISRLNRYRRLLTERSRFEWAIEHLDDGFLLLRDGEVIDYMNSAARIYLGIVKDNEMIEGFLQRIDKLYKREPAQAWENWPAHQAQPQRYLVRPETGHEPPLWLEVNVLESDNVNEQLVRLCDVSDKMLLQRQMWSFQLMVSHKLRTPLNAFTILQILRRKKNAFSSETLELLEMLQIAIDRLQNQVLEVVRYVETSHLLKLNTPFNLSELPSLVTSIQEALALKTVTVSIDDSLQEKAVLLSAQGLELVLRELLNNAKKFHPQQSPQVEVSIKPADAQTIVLSVTDNGRHLPNEELTQVWTPYYQHEKYFSGELQGMGLGLAMVARLIWGSDGCCQLYNREDQPGVRVELILPFSTEP